MNSKPGSPDDEIGPGSARLGLDLDAVDNPAGNTFASPYAVHTRTSLKTSKSITKFPKYQRLSRT